MTTVLTDSVNGSVVEGQKRLEQKAGQTLKRSTAIAFQNKMKIAQLSS